MKSRLEALAAGLQAPLLVTNLVNIRYLTGFDASNAALLVEPKGRPRLFTDFRYIESAREVDGVEALRAVKDADEVATIGRAARAAERAFEALTAETWVGRSERELAWRLRQLMHAHGVDELSFDTAIAAG